MYREKGFSIDRIKQATQGGEYVEFSAKVLPFDEVDLVGDYATSETEGELRTEPLPLLFNHDTERVIGAVTSLRKESDGFYIDGKIKRKFACPEMQDVSDAIAEGLIRGISGGFFIEQGTPTESGLHYDRFVLYEVSVVAIPSFTTYGIETKSKAMINRKQMDEEQLQLMLEQFANDIKSELVRLEERIQALIDMYQQGQAPNEEDVKEAQKTAEKYKRFAEDFLKRIESIKINL
jgi:HK97 family phage prohead protease